MQQFLPAQRCLPNFCSMDLLPFTTPSPRFIFFYIFNMAATEKGGVAVAPPSGALSKLVCLAQTFAVRIVLLAMK